MNRFSRRTIIISFTIFVITALTAITYFLVTPRLPSTQQADKTVIIDNYKEYTGTISSDSFGDLGNYLYRFIKQPTQGIYHATITEGSYSYNTKTLFSVFTVKLIDADISWNVSMQTIKNGDINGDISITCTAGSTNCLSLSDRLESKRVLQDLLPINTTTYIIAIQKNNYDGLSIIYYDQDSVGKTNALEKIKSLGFNPEDYTIEYFYGGR